MIVEWNPDKSPEETVVNLTCQSLPVVDTLGAGNAFCRSLSAYFDTGPMLAKAATKACPAASMSVEIARCTIFVSYSKGFNGYAAN
eukprot:4040426-Ditylum_brightwellii.AAC.1